jgi:hypothetical protein
LRLRAKKSGRAYRRRTSVFAYLLPVSSREKM